MRVSFIVPGVPEGKRRPRTRVLPSKGKGPLIVTIYSDPADVKREALIRDIARDAMRGRAVFPHAVSVRIEAVFEPAPSWPRSKRELALANLHHIAKPDADNIAKSILDGLMADPKARVEADRAPFCIADDTQVADLRVTKRYGSPTRVEVVIEDLSPPLLLVPDTLPPRRSRKVA